MVMGDPRCNKDVGNLRTRLGITSLLISITQALITLGSVGTRQKLLSRLDWTEVYVMMRGVLGSKKGHYEISLN